MDNHLAAGIYTHKGQRFRAAQWDGQNRAGITNFHGTPFRMTELAHLGPCLVVPTLDGSRLARAGDWVVEGIEGELYPCPRPMFAVSYKLHEDLSV